MIADVCTGSGAIALSIKNYFKDSVVYASDYKDECLNVAKKNANNLELDINFLKGDKLNPFLENNIKLDVLISNPPYVKNIDDIEEKVKINEPLDAIFIEGGLLFYETFFKSHNKVMKNDFFMGFEINYDQEEDLSRLIRKYFGENVRYIFEKDIYNLTRYLFILGGYEDKSF